MTTISGSSHNKTCRVCLISIVSNGIHIECDSSWVQLFDFCFSIKVHPEDMSRKLCKDCANKLNDFAQFKKLALRSDLLWQSSIKIPLKKTDYEGEQVIKQDYNGEISDTDYFHDTISESLVTEDKINYQEYPEHGNDFFEENNVKIKLEVCTENEKTNDESGTRSKQKDKKYICEECGKQFCSKTLLKKHLKNKCLIKKKNFYCGLCDTTLLDMPQIKEHLTTEHIKRNDLKCSLCDYVGRDFADMSMHRYRHMPKECISTIMCPLASCDKVFHVELALQYHYRTEHLKKIGGLCSVCNKQYRVYKCWRNHERLHRSQNYICDICGLKFLFRNAIVEHMVHHSDYKRYMCDTCGKTFKRNSNLKAHLNTVHDKKKVKCKHCNKIYKNKLSLRYHMHKVALGTPYQCDVCSKGYGTPGELKSHMIWHNNDRPFVCNVCGLSYKAKGQLNIHMRKHTGILPFECEFCKRCFPSSNQLKVHKSVHTGQRKYKCLQCPRSFNGKKLLEEHSVRRHNGQNMEVFKKDDMETGHSQRSQ